MARKPPAISYEHLSIGPSPSRPQDPVAPHAPAPSTKKTMRDEAAPVTLYLHPDARKALKRYALEQELKVHDLLLEAVEDWFRSHGLRETVRVTLSGER